MLKSPWIPWFVHNANLSMFAVSRVALTAMRL